MRVLISSFGLAMNWPWEGKSFHRMPPVCLDYQHGFSFTPDYATYLLFDEFIMDSHSFDLLKDQGEHRKPLDHLRDVLYALKASGRLTLLDFEATVSPYSNIIEQSVRYDLSQIDKWSEEFAESSRRWLHFTNSAYQIIKSAHGEIELASGRYGIQHWQPADSARHDLTEDEQFYVSFFSAQPLMYPVVFHFDVIDTIREWRKKVPDSDRQNTRQLVAEYLRYVSTNLCLSDLLDAAVHDWHDMEPFYSKKLGLGARPDNKALDHSAEAKKLFDLLFPLFRPESAAIFAKALDDRRIVVLRELVAQAVRGEVEFDHEFVNATLRDVLRINEKELYKRKIVGWLTFPIGFIPWVGSVAQKGLECAAGSIIESRARKPKEWFYLISSISGIE